MKVILLQTDICWADPAANVAYMDKLISAHAQDTDLFVLPEMFSTGFCTLPEGIAESSDSATLQWMKQKAAERNCAIAGSVSVEENGKFYNRFYFVHPDGNVQWYNKKHLFTYGGEDKHYTAGQERVVVNFRGVRFLLEVCYDLRFPVWSRNRGDYDAAIYVASWPSPRVEAWKALLRARAIENQCYVCGVNRVGVDGKGFLFRGDSMIYNAKGKKLADAGKREEITRTCTLKKSELDEFRAKFPAWKDADGFSIDF